MSGTFQKLFRSKHLTRLPNMQKHVSPGFFRFDGSVRTDYVRGS